MLLQFTTWTVQTNCRHAQPVCKQMYKPVINTWTDSNNSSVTRQSGWQQSKQQQQQSGRPSKRAWQQRGMRHPGQHMMLLAMHKRLCNRYKMCAIPQTKLTLLHRQYLTVCLSKHKQLLHKQATLHSNLQARIIRPTSWKRFDNKKVLWTNYCAKHEPS